LNPPRRFRTGFHSRRRARGGLVRNTARTSRALPCKSGTVTKTATAATRPLSLVWCCLRRHLTHALLRAMKLTRLTMTLGHAVAVSRIPTAISLSYRSLTHGLCCTSCSSHTGVSFTHTASLKHAISLTHAVSFTHAVLLTHRLSPTLCARLNTHFTTLVTTHTGTTHTGTTMLGIRATTRGPGASIPPKFRVYPSTALAPPNSQSSTRPTWS